MQPRLPPVLMNGFCCYVKFIFANVSGKPSDYFMSGFQLGASQVLYINLTQRCGVLLEDRLFIGSLYQQRLNLLPFQGTADGVKNSIKPGDQ